MQPRFIAVPTLVVAGSIYLPLMPFDALGVPVFGKAESWGWASPSLLGWALLLVVWATFWWAVTAGVARLLRSRVGSS